MKIVIRGKRKGMLIFLAFVGVLGVFCPQQLPAQDETGFPDVPKNHWAYQAVTDLKRRGILVGYPPGSVSREESHPAEARALVRPSGDAITHRHPSASHRAQRDASHPARRKAGRRR